MYCLWCHENFFEKTNWKFVFAQSKESVICQQCHSKLVAIEGEICEKCGRSFRNLESQFRHENICYDCIRWGGGTLVKNRSLYVYNHFLQEIIAKWKYRGDAQLVKLFLPGLQKLANQFENVDIVVPIPLSKNRQYERSFNQAKALAEGLTQPLLEPLTRTEEAAKQSKKGRKERLNREEKFQLLPSFPYDLQGKTVLLVDDIYTTGATLYSAATVLKEHARVANIFSVTVARG